MSTNKINIEAVNARACQEKTPMTKIPSVEERVDWEAKFEIEFSHIKSTNKHIPAQIDTRDYKDIKNFITTLLTAEREAGAREYRQFILNVLDGTDIADGECNTKAIRFAIASRIIK